MKKRQVYVIKDQGKGVVSGVTANSLFSVSEDSTIIVGSGSVETDPIFTASPAFGITESDKTLWNDKDYNNLSNLPDLSLKADLVGSKVPASQLPSYVDDVLEFDNMASFPSIGEAGKLYVDLETNKLYRWSGSAYIDMTPGEADTLQTVTDRGDSTDKNLRIKDVIYGGDGLSGYIIIGNDESYNNTISGGNTVIGFGSGSPFSGNNIIVGNNSFTESFYSFNNNIVGNFSCREVSIMDSNNVFGYNTALRLSGKSGNNLILGNNVGFKRKQIQNKLFIGSYGSETDVEVNEGLISGDFLNETVNLNAKFSITPNKLTVSDNSYTKNIVAKTDGTFGWEDKISSVTQIKEFFDAFTGTTLTLSNTPKAGTIVNVIENGITLREGSTRDYTISDKIITLLTSRTNVDIEINYTY